MKKVIVILIGFIFVASMGITVSAQSGRIEDPANDVFYYNRGSIGSNIATKPDIDIREITYSFEGNTLTLTMRVEGTISSADNFYYNIELKTDDDVDYEVSYSDGEGSAYALGDGDYHSGDISINGSTLTATIPMAGSSTTVTHFSSLGSEFGSGGIDVRWNDWAPDSEVPSNWLGGQTTTPADGNGTPGFELLAVLVALGAALLLIKRKD